ncbi:SMC-Scp complex subunit ScpB [Curtobacterium sp. MCBD17_034]|uniref:SMC-Scp complex subunit ScpB n=1 Tax=unclassified Curtobacterium TaxID=257496 RepID=UPI000DA74F64|nr:MULTISPECIES: SMC-Scp complex subunit ScpB [unclassified Curtobacterium]PZF61260.1 SMC-Scp complex subunit ScpB [Curtobacterium sp. MCBD17_034]PZM33093.1 SMC-Scp complex subunit ScpB [Curtobacterium sp. MCBD17_031]
MTDDSSGGRAGGSDEPGGADEIAEARFAEQELREGEAVDAANGADAARSGAAGLGVPIDRQIEAILMIADEPQTPIALATAVGAPVPAVRQAIDRLVHDFDGADGGVRRGFELREVGGGWRFYVRSELDPVVEQFVRAERPARLSQAALETLAVVAYKQPITRAQIASIRAVNVDGVVRTLVARGLIAESFTDSETGAINYVTTDLLLTQLGINTLEELPLISPLLEDGTEGFADGRA